MTRVALFLPFVLACSSGSPQFTEDSGVPSDAGVDAADAQNQQKDGGSVIDAAPDAIVDAGSDPFSPHPPPGSTKCGSGTITSSSAQMTCTEPNWILDDAPLPDGGMGAVPRSCSALTIGAGEWQAWCTANNAYVWARIPITNANVLQDCHGLSLIEIDLGYYASGNGGGNGVTVGTYEADGTQIAGTAAGDSQTIVTSVNVGNGPNGGSASVWVAGSLEDTCNNAVFDPPTVLTGFDATWK